LLVGDALQQRRQLVAFLVRERRTQCPLMLSRNLGNVLQDLAAFARQVQRVAPPIARLIAAFQQAALFQVVDQRDQAAGRDAELSSKRLLADPFCGLNDSKNSGISRNELECPKSFGKGRGSMASNLRQEERRRAGTARRLRCRTRGDSSRAALSFTHENIVPDNNDYVM
jgi:hypothetical protein